MASQTGTIEVVEVGGPEQLARDRIAKRTEDRERARDMVWTYLKSRLGDITVEVATADLLALHPGLTRRKITEAIYESLRGRQIAIKGDGTIAAVTRRVDATAD